MATYAAIFQQAPALMGTPTNFTVTIYNTGGSQVNILSIQPLCQTPGGGLATSVNIGEIAVPPQLGLAQVGGSQFNVPVTGGTNVSFGFQASFFGPNVAGVPAGPSNQYSMSAIVSMSDGTSFQTPALTLAINTPSNASPPNPSSTVGALQFFNPLNSAFPL